LKPAARASPAKSTLRLGSGWPPFASYVPLLQTQWIRLRGAAAAMVLRYWGTTGISAEDFAPLVDRGAGGIRTTDLVRALDARGVTALAAAGTRALAHRELEGRVVRAPPMRRVIERVGRHAGGSFSPQEPSGRRGAPGSATHGGPKSAPRNSSRPRS